MFDLPESCYHYRYERQASKIISTCLDCGSFIQEGDEYYDIRGMIICKDCMADYKKEAETND